MRRDARTGRLLHDAPFLWDPGIGLGTVVIGGLLLALLFGLVAWFILTLQGDDMPEGMAVLIGTIGGGLVGLITSSKNSEL